MIMSIGAKQSHAMHG